MSDQSHQLDRTLEQLRDDNVGVVTRLDQEISRSARYRRPLTVVVLKPTAPVGGIMYAGGAHERLQIRIAAVRILQAQAQLGIVRAEQDHDWLTGSRAGARVAPALRPPAP